MTEFTEEFVTSLYLSQVSPPKPTALAKELVDKELRELKSNQSPIGASRILYVTGGIPGSGKGSIVSSILEEDSGILVIDPDLIKRSVVLDVLQRYPELRPDIEASESWASVVHEVSSFCAKWLCLMIIEENQWDLLYDATMGGENVRWYPQLCGKAKSKGYFVSAHICATSLKEAQQRATTRSGSSITLHDGVRLKGRVVPPSHIVKASELLPRNIVKYQQQGLYEVCYYLYPNNGRLDELSVYEKGGV